MLNMAINNLLPIGMFYMCSSWQALPHSLPFFHWVSSFLLNFRFSFTSHLPKGKMKSQENNWAQKSELNVVKKISFRCMVDCISIQHLYISHPPTTRLVCWCAAEKLANALLNFLQFVYSHFYYYFLIL